MEKINIQDWKEFQIADLFVTQKVKHKTQVPTGASIPKLFLNKGTIPRISATNINNGILGYYEEIEDDRYRTFENFISVSFLGTIFYHNYKASLDMKIHCLKLKERDLNKFLAFYLISIIRKKIKNIEYNNQISSTVLPKISIKLPVDTNKEPNWEYMERYIKQLYARENDRVQTMINAKTIKNIL